MDFLTDPLAYRPYDEFECRYVISSNPNLRNFTVLKGQPGISKSDCVTNRVKELAKEKVEDDTGLGCPLHPSKKRKKCRSICFHKTNPKSRYSCSHDQDLNAVYRCDCRPLCEAENEVLAVHELQVSVHTKSLAASISRFPTVRRCHNSLLEGYTHLLLLPGDQFHKIAHVLDSWETLDCCFQPAAGARCSGSWGCSRLYGLFLCVILIL